MTNLDSILKSRDITLPTKVCLVKPMVFPVVMYGCESWTEERSSFEKNRAEQRTRQRETEKNGEVLTDELRRTETKREYLTQG